MRRTLLIMVALATLAACTGESALPEATGKGTVRAINTIATSPSISFLIEERSIGSIDYKNASAPQQYDDLEYNFNFDVALPVVGRQRVATQFLDVVADKDYTFVISGNLAAPVITVWEADVRTFDETPSVFQGRFANTGTIIGDVDVYFAAPGVVPALGEQIATLAFGEVSAPVDYTGSEYVLIYTAAGDPTTVLFTSDTITPAAGTAFTISIFDGDPNDVGPVSVRVFDSGGSTSSIADVGILPTIRFFHASMALASSDIYNDETLTTPLVMDHVFGDITGDIPVEPGTNSLTYTTAGDTGVLLFESDVTAFQGAHLHFYVIGETDALSPIAINPDRRPVESFAKFSILHAAFNHPTVDLYIVDADADITDLFPLLSGVPAGTPPLARELQEGSFDLYLTTTGEKTVIVGPVRLDLALGDIVDVMVLDNVDPAIADIVFIPDP